MALTFVLHPKSEHEHNNETDECVMFILHSSNSIDYVSLLLCSSTRPHPDVTEALRAQEDPRMPNLKRHVHVWHQDHSMILEIKV
jgi:hypothetical protein